MAGLQARLAGGTKADGPNGLLSQYVKAKATNGSQYAKGGASNKTLKLSGFAGNNKSISMAKGYKGGAGNKTLKFKTQNEN